MNNNENPNNYQRAEDIERVFNKDHQEILERKEASKEEIAEEERKLKFFSEVMGDCEYCIGGGLAFELYKGVVLKTHDDIDINVPEDNVEEIKKRLEANGFKIYKNPNPIGGHDLDAQ